MAGYSDIRIGSLVSAVLTRAVFCLHCFIAFWRIIVTTEWNQLYLLLGCGLVGLAVETLITLLVRKGAEYKWLCPSVFFYLTTIVPCIWILEWNQLEHRILKMKLLSLNITDLTLNITLKMIGIDEEDVPENKEAERNLTEAWLPAASILTAQMERLKIGSHQWVVLVEQMLLFLLILGRWALPKGNISRNELSQLLLVYIGMAADIIEFFEAFKEEMVKTNRTLTLSILSIWSASLLQFSFVLTASGARRTRAAGVQAIEQKKGAESKDDTGRPCGGCCSCCGTEVCGIVTTMILQDGPFVSLRLLLLIKYEVYSYMHIFFTVKNSLVLLLLFYRLFVLFDSRRHVGGLEELGALDGLEEGLLGVALVGKEAAGRSTNQSTGASSGTTAREAGRSPRCAAAGSGPGSTVAVINTVSSNVAPAPPPPPPLKAPSTPSQAPLHHSRSPRSNAATAPPTRQVGRQGQARADIHFAKTQK